MSVESSLDAWESMECLSPLDIINIDHYNPRDGWSKFALVIDLTQKSNIPRRAMSLAYKNNSSAWEISKYISSRNILGGLVVNFAPLRELNSNKSP